MWSPFELNDAITEIEYNFGVTLIEPKYRVHI